MVGSQIVESDVEEMAVHWFRDLGYQVEYGPDISPNGAAPLRDSYQEVVLHSRLELAIRRFNPSLPDETIKEVVQKVIYPKAPDLDTNNHEFHRYFLNGVQVEYQGATGCTVGVRAKLFDFDNPEMNDWLVANQFTVKEGDQEGRPDIVVFVNGLPLAVIELKNSQKTSATIRTAFDDIQAYKHLIPSLFHFNESLVISDGIKARHGTITAGWERFMPWRTIDGDHIASPNLPQLEVLVRGMFDKARFLDLVKNFVSCETDGSLVKKMAAYHQYHAVNAAVKTTVEAAKAQGPGKGGVIWHTQGSGKSLSMVFLTSRLIRQPELQNPTVVVLADRSDLDNQLFSSFAAARDLIPFPKQAKSRPQLKELLRVPSGGIIFTTVQKFFPEEGAREYPELSDRHNIIVIADEAHRTQYGFLGQGFARNVRRALPNATFIGFTGTPIEHADRNTRQVFGDYIDIYDIQQSVEDDMTVPIYYESRLATLHLDNEGDVEAEFDELTEGVDERTRDRVIRNNTRLEEVLGAHNHVAAVARDIVEHWEERRKAFEGKAMVVAMRRWIAAKMYDEIVKLRPEWHSANVNKGRIKVIVSESESKHDRLIRHLHSDHEQEEIKKRFKDPGDIQDEDRLEMVIVCDKWLTGFDMPCLNTMYMDRLLRGHSLMQAIARVNRPYKDKQGGLIVDYVGIGHELKKALGNYTEGASDNVGVPIDKAVELFKEKYDVVSSMLHGFDHSDYLSSDKEKVLKTIIAGANHITSDPDLKQRFLKGVVELSKAFSLATPHEEVLALSDNVAYYQDVKSNIVKYAATEEEITRAGQDIESGVRQLISRAIVADGVVNILEEGGLKTPDISILSDEFLEQIKVSPYRNLQLEMLKKLINGEINAQSKKNIVQAKSFKERLEKTIAKYHNQAIDSVQVLTELIELAKDLRDAPKRAEELGLTDDEVAFYDALAQNNSAVELMGDETLKRIASDLVVAIRNNVSIDWTIKESVRAKLRAPVKRLLTRYGYPPDQAEVSTQIVFEQMEALGEGLVAD